MFETSDRSSPNSLQLSAWREFEKQQNSYENTKPIDILINQETESKSKEDLLSYYDKDGFKYKKNMFFSYLEKQEYEQSLEHKIEIDKIFNKTETNETQTNTTDDNSIHTSTSHDNINSENSTEETFKLDNNNLINDGLIFPIEL